LANQNIQKPRKAATKFPKNKIFAKGFSPKPHEKFFFDLKSWGHLKSFKIESGSYSGQAYP
jgi:hypothetical protein